MEKAKEKSKVRGWIIKAAGSALLLGLLFWYLPRDAIIDGLGRVPPMLFLTVLVAFLLSHVAAAAKWWVILGRPCSFPIALRAHFGGLAANLCLPGALGGDAVRATMIHAAMRNKGMLAAGAVADRIIDMLALVLMSAIGLLMMEQQGVDVGPLLKAGMSILFLVVVLAVLLPMMLPRLWDVFPKLPGRSFALEVREAFGQLSRRPVMLALVQFGSVAIQFVLVLLAYWLALAVGLDIALGAWIFAWPLAKLLAILPVSLGGLGLREATLAALLVPFGAIGAQVVAAGLAWQGILFLAGGLGAIVVLLSRSHAKQTVSEIENSGRIIE